MTKSTPLTLMAAQVEDVPAFVDIEFAAFRDETVNQKLSYRDASNPLHRIRTLKAYRKLIQRANRQQWIPNPGNGLVRSDSAVDVNEDLESRVIFLKVVDSSTGQIVAFAKAETSALTSSDLQTPCDQGHENEPYVNREWFALNEKLRRQYNDFGMLATHPDHQRRGAGSMLLEAILADADRRGAEIYLEATAQGRPLYERFGFVPVYDLVFDSLKYGHPEIGIERQTVMVRGSRNAFGKRRHVKAWKVAVAERNVLFAQ